MAQHERRQAPRYVADMSAYCYKIEKNGTSERHLAKVKGCVGEKEGEVVAPDKITDISKGGLFLMTVTSYPVDTILVTELMLPGQGGTVSTVGVVRWTREVKGDEPYIYGYGIHFLYVKKDDWSKIERYLSQLKPYTLL